MPFDETGPILPPWSSLRQSHSGSYGRELVQSKRSPQRAFAVMMLVVMTPDANPSTPSAEGNHHGSAKLREVVRDLKDRGPYLSLWPHFS